MQEEYTLTKIADIRSLLSGGNPPASNQFTTGGLIVDSTGVFRKGQKTDYMMRLKILDPVSTSTCIVFLYNRNQDEFPKNIKIGDILFIHKFSFQIYQENLQAKKSYKTGGDMYRFFSGDPEKDSYDPIDSFGGADDSEGKILKLIRDLRKSSKTYFKNNAVPVMSKNSNLSSDFDVILEVKSCEKVENNLFKVFLKNNTHEYELNYGTNVEPGVYKIRSVADCNWKTQKKINLIGNDYTFILEISPWMKSYNPTEWDKCVPANKNVEPQQRDKISGRIIQKKNDKRKYTSLKDLIHRDVHEEDVRVICEFVQVFTTFEKALKKYDAKNHTEKGYQSIEGEYIYNIHFAITDQSLEGEVFNVFIYSYDKKGDQFLPGINHSGIYGKNVLGFKEQYDHIMTRLLEESDVNETPIQLILSPLSSGKETIYRIVDTELLI